MSRSGRRPDFKVQAPFRASACLAGGAATSRRGTFRDSLQSQISQIRWRHSPRTGRQNQCPHSTFPRQCSGRRYRIHLIHQHHLDRRSAVRPNQRNLQRAPACRPRNHNRHLPWPPRRAWPQRDHTHPTGEQVSCGQRTGPRPAQRQPKAAFNGRAPPRRARIHRRRPPRNNHQHTRKANGKAEPHGQVLRMGHRQVRKSDQAGDPSQPVTKVRVCNGAIAQSSPSRFATTVIAARAQPASV